MMKEKIIKRNQSFLILFCCLASLTCNRNSHNQDWALYSADATGSKYSTLDQINKENVDQLELSWTYACEDHSTRSTIECNPLIIDGVIYLTTPAVKLVALDATTGKELWVFDDGQSDGGVNRGVTFWQENDIRRILFVKGFRLYAINAIDGKPDPRFGTDGQVDLYEGLQRNVRHTWVTAATPGIIYRDKIILGSTLGEGPAPAAPGYIRAYNVRTGSLEWTFHTIPNPGEEGYETWPPDAYTWAGGVNAWGGFTLDEDRGLVFCGTGSSTYDHYGGNRKGSNLFANCILALNADTGKKVWHYQTVHHDIWDYDLPCPPNLVQVKRDGRLIDAVAQPTKMGHLFVLDRQTGEPVHPVEELEVPQSELPGEETWPSQPFPIEGLRYAGQFFDDKNVTNINDVSAESVKLRLAEMNTGGIFLPPGIKPSVVLPQFNGGTDWGGAAYDPMRRKIIVNSSNEAEWISMVSNAPPKEISRFDYGRDLFQSLCTQCHSMSISPDPSLVSLTALRETVAQRTDRQVIDVLSKGKGQMPQHGSLTDDEKASLLSFLRDHGHEEKLNFSQIKTSIPQEITFIATGHNEFKDPDGYPVNRPPWGMLTSINLDSGTIDWQVPLGTYPELEKRGIPPTGTFNMGGPVVTKSGLIFIGASMDERFHIYDAENGNLLWEFQLEAGGYATPSTFMVDGKQYVVIAGGGGGKPGTKAGDKYYCFSLP